MATFGETLVKSVSDYLVQNGLRSIGQINGPILQDIADRTHTFYIRQMEQKEQALSDEEWLGKIQKREGELGLNVRQQYSMAQVWYENNGQTLTRRKFLKWLKESDRPLHTGDSKADKGPIRLDPYQEPSWDWRRVMATKWPRETHPDRPAYEEMPWGEVSLTVRQEILKAYAKTP
jgi:hypothetical protein